jgi:hypothetical protein
MLQPLLRPKGAFLGLMLFIAACSKKAPQNADYNARIGVAIQMPNRLCMAIRNPKLLPSATIILIAPRDPASERIGASTARAEVLARGADACPGSKADAEINNYDLGITSGSLKPNSPVIALDARVPSVYAAHSFHSCTSADGVDLTAWDGAKPLEGHRLWHRHYHIGRVLAPNCTTDETAP